MMASQFDTGLVVFWVTLYLFNTFTSGLVPKPDSIEKLSGGVIKTLPVSRSGLKNKRKNINTLALLNSKEGSTLNIENDEGDSMQHVLEESHSGLLLKLKSSREEILKSGGEEAYSNLQRLLDNLDLYQFESSREVYRIYEASLKFQKERLGENHLKKLELGFIRAHMNSLIKDNNTRAKFEEILKKMEEALSFSPNWLNVLHMNSVKQDSPTFFAEKVLFLHALNYCYGVYHNFKYGSPIRTKVDIFEECFNLFKRQLMVLLDLAESENCSQVDISTDFPVMHYLLGLELMAMRNSLPGEDEIERRKSRFLKQYNKLERTYNNFFYSPSFFGTVDLKNEITIWENNTPMNEINNEINMLHGLHKSMKIVEKSDA
ncbi:hypothetical protein BY996DRAFT_6413946 [Phakopsora pachyrhizi]|nr:hypothetical protein BY996DRAFT_6413946 [Phakopsora pachyrhizi]